MSRFHSQTPYSLSAHLPRPRIVAMPALSAEDRAALAGFFDKGFGGLKLHKANIQDKLVASEVRWRGGGVGRSAVGSRR